MTRSISMLVILFAMIITACSSSSNGSSDRSQQENSEIEGQEQEQDYQANETLIAWVDLLNVRAEPNTKGEIVASLRENATVTYTGERTDESETIELRGTSFEEPWLKIRTADGKEGWVFGGAVRREGESKGVQRSTMSVGELVKLEMSQWTKRSEWTSSGGDSESVTTIYTKGDLTLAIRKTEVGEYGYSRMYDLYNKDFQLVKRRFVNWSGEHPSFSLVETIMDLESNPAKTFKRSQPFSKHFFQLKPRPESVQGDFQEAPLPKLEAATLNASILSEAFAFQEIPSNVDTDGGCSCNFEPSEAATGMMIFASDMGENAAIRINGKMIQLKDDMPRLKQRGAQEVWITLKEKGADELFGEPLNSSGDWQQEILKGLKETMMAMEEIPTEPRIKSIGTVGMGHRGTVRDLWNDAVSQVKGKKSDDNGLELRYAGDGYTCKITARQTSRNDGGGGKYEGFLEILSETGKSLSSWYVYGDCGC